VKVSSDQRAENRQRILEAASRLFREHGPDGVNVADITKAAGLTHGGFYGHFTSKDALLAEAVEHALVSQAEVLVKAGGHAELSRFVDGYLSRAHVDNRGGGCAVAALGSDIPRQNPDVQAAFAKGLARLIDAAAGPSGCNESRTAAICALAQAIGTVVMARAVEDVDAKLADELLEIGRQLS
jgi:TetR/AcrR family transcriptional regulator, transcriptional repressor for nem operon